MRGCIPLTPILCRCHRTKVPKRFSVRHMDFLSKHYTSGCPTAAERSVDCTLYLQEQLPDSSKSHVDGHNPIIRVQEKGSLVQVVFS